MGILVQILPREGVVQAVDVSARHLAGPRSSLETSVHACSVHCWPTADQRPRHDGAPLLAETQKSGRRSSDECKEQEEKADTWHRLERTTGRFLRRFRLPENARMDQVRATMENGVLTVVVPKEEEAKKPEVKAIDISG
ncbi:18.1 kDa class I heat shock protein [Striga hermonthica]|uniref:18.1 kDa class I heat shock protein n=1 Tax=Striga hermonthica TaxID=68872 RepID=A0A9N7MPL2_STRHE|nr:18.1 kDa class I heat shock protein [Striga hermonthica]